MHRTCIFWKHRIVLCSSLAQWQSLSRQRGFLMAGFFLPVVGNFLPKFHTATPPSFTGFGP